MEPSQDHVSIDSIKLTINGLTVELKIDQARQLWKQLDDIFGPQPAYPIWIYPPYYTEVPTFMPTCSKTEVLVNPNAEPFPDHWVVGYSAHNNKSCLEIHA